RVRRVPSIVNGGMTLDEAERSTVPDPNLAGEPDTRGAETASPDESADRERRRPRAGGRFRQARKSPRSTQQPIRLHTDFRLVRRLIGMSFHYWPHVLGLLLLGLTTAPFALLGPLPMKIAVDSVIGSQPLPKWIGPVVPVALRSSKGGLLAFAAGLILAT